MTSREDQQKAKAMTTSAQTMLDLADRLEKLQVKHRPDWYVDQEPHDYEDGTKNFNHVRYNVDHGDHEMTVEVAHYVTPDLGELLCALHNNLDTILAALRAAPPATGDVRRETIEECAALCDNHGKWLENNIRATMSNAANDCAALIRALASVAPGPSEAAIQKSAPVCLSAHNSGERDPAVTPDRSGADTAPSL